MINAAVCSLSLVSVSIIAFTRTFSSYRLEKQSEGQDRDLVATGTVGSINHPAEDETAPLIPPVDGLISGARFMKNKTTWPLRRACIVLFWAAGVSYAWLPAIESYLVSGEWLLAFLVAGQLAGTLGRFISLWPISHGLEWTYFYTLLSSFAAMCVFGLGSTRIRVFEEHANIVNSITVGLNMIFNFSIGLLATNFFMDVPSALRCASCVDDKSKSPRLHCPECHALAQKGSQSLGIWLTVGAGLHSIVAYFVIHYLVVE